ncbi:AlwI family type II restriction endonuclease [Streptococcus respiraculi]|uniref:AlwI family type II restriction endonuclease n=1 Tax=Streptococcus respiraculi TaxID=2021971 RepID=UPI000E74E6CF|nr:AlwI family type II restriction endonuclease [Streptococcus respiraculi]
MKLDSPQSIFNMGDTSIRVKQLVDVNRIILSHISKYMKDGLTWERNTSLQEDFYKSFIDEIVRLEEEEGIELFNDFKRAKNYTLNTSRIGLRGRTLTNAVMKAGFITQQRRLSSVGKAYLSHTLKNADAIEKILGLSEDNLVYLRQFLKLRVYSSETDRYFYNFRFALLFLSRYTNVPQKDFLKLIESIKPDQSEKELNDIIDEYMLTYKNEELFEEFYKRVFAPTLRSNEELQKVKLMFLEDDLSDENFIKYFNNRDSNATSLLYKRFVSKLLAFHEQKKESIYNEIILLSKEAKIKKAFGENRNPFIIRNKMTMEEFVEENIDNPLLSGDGYKIYLQFIFSKHNDLISEYSDMCRRSFQVTGLISFENGLVNLNNGWVISPLIDLLGDKFCLTGEDLYINYEQKDDSIWFEDLSIVEILNISEIEIDLLYSALGREFGIDDLTEVNNLIVRKREEEYREFISEHFPIDKIIDILGYIIERDDEKIFGLVTESATVPTIYEYILTIAWYYISDKKNYLVHKAFQVSLDGNKLPLTHRGGGAGDIEIVNEDYCLLIEATLMDMNTQKRGELEPVIRHSINFALDNLERESRTLFVANELDNNVLNIFRASQFVEFNGTLNSGTVKGISIFALTTSEIIAILEKRITDMEILQTMSQFSNSLPNFVTNNWREEFVAELLN